MVGDAVEAAAALRQAHQVQAGRALREVERRGGVFARVGGAVVKGADDASKGAEGSWGERDGAELVDGRLRGRGCWNARHYCRCLGGWGERGREVSVGGDARATAR